MRIRKAAIMGIVAGSIIGLAGTASAAVLTFDAASACVGPCSQYSPFSQSYGDTAFMDVSYASLDGFGNATVVDANAFYWDTLYGDLTDVAYGGFNSTDVLQITFTALNGAILKLNSFDVAGYPSTNRPTNIRFYDLSYNLLDSINFVAPGVGHYTGSCPSCSVAQGFILQLGPDGYNVAIDNIDVTAVPEPNSWALLIAGFGLTGAVLRRRRAVAA